jgi:cytochrome c peroxidase
MSVVSSGIQNHPNLSPALRTDSYGPPKRMNLTEIQKQDLISFLYTLTDESMRTDRRFSNPFK